MTDTKVLYEDEREALSPPTATHTRSSSTGQTTSRGKEREHISTDTGDYTTSRLSPATSPSAPFRYHDEGKAAVKSTETTSHLGVAAPAAVAGVTPGTETFQVPRAAKAHIIRAPIRWLLAVDEGEGSGWAFNHVLNNMDRENDTLIMITVCPRKIVDEHYSREVLLRYAIRAERLGLKNVKLWLHMGKDVGAVLCSAAKETGSNTLVLGHSRYKDRWPSWGTTSTSQHVKDHAPCTVIIVQEKEPLQGADIVAEAQMKDDLERRRRLGVPDTDEVVREPVVETFEKHLTVNGKTYAVEVTF